MKKNINKILSIILVLVMAFSIVPVITIAAKSDKVTVRIEGTGETILLAPTEVEVNSGDTAKDALEAALLAKGYDITDTNVLNLNGGFINTILGTSGDSVNYSTYWMYTLNNQGASLGIGQQKVVNGDELVFYFVENWANSYAYFDKSDIEVKKGTSFLLNLKISGYDVNFNPVVSACEGATLVIDNTDSANVTDANGNVTLSFASAGTYYITAKKISSGTNTLDGTYCKVVVNESDPVAINRLDDLSVFSGSTQQTLSPSFCTYNLNYRLSVEYDINSIKIRPVSALGGIKVNSQSVTSGSDYQVGLLVGTNIISVSVDSDITYKVIVERSEKVVEQDKQTAINNILNACSEKYINSTDYWKILGMARMAKGAAVDNYAAAEAVLNEYKKLTPSATSLGMWAVTLNSLGYDCTKIDDNGVKVDIISKLYNMDDETLNPYDSFYCYIYWLLGVKSGNYTVPDTAPQTESEVISKLISLQDENGGWYYTWGSLTYFDADGTAMAVSALAPYYSTNASVKAAVDKAIVWLESQQLSTGGYGNTNTDSMVVIALVSMGIDPDGDTRFIKNGVSVFEDMLSYKTSYNFFGYNNTDFDDTATKQGFCATLTYSEFLKDTNSAYNLYLAGTPQGAVTVSNISIETNPTKAIYSTGDDFEVSGMTIKVSYSDTTNEIINVTSYMISGFDSSSGGTKTVTVTYGGVDKTFYVTVSGQSNNNEEEKTTKTVTISVIGDSEKGTILSSKSLTVNKDASVFTILRSALLEEDIEFAYEGSGTAVYIKTIDGLSEYDKGANSGWKYYVNGQAPNQSCGAYIPDDGDVIRFKYTSDYTKDSDSQDMQEEQQEEIKTIQEYKEQLKTFKDSDKVSDWAVEYMSKAVERGIIKGDSQSNLNSQNFITRGEFCAMLIRALDQSVSSDDEKIFYDVSNNSWYFAYIKKAYQLGIVKGTSDNTFSPDLPITRQDMAVMVSNAFGLKSNNNSINFNDSNKISAYAYDAVSKVYFCDIMKGDGQNFYPTSQTTREMAVTVLIRYLDSKN